MTLYPPGQLTFDATEHPDYYDDDEPAHGIRCECPECEEQPILGEG